MYRAVLYFLSPLVWTIGARLPTLIAVVDRASLALRLGCTVNGDAGLLRVGRPLFNENGGYPLYEIVPVLWQFWPGVGPTRFRAFAPMTLPLPLNVLLQSCYTPFLRTEYQHSL